MRANSSNSDVATEGRLDHPAYPLAVVGLAKEVEELCQHILGGTVIASKDSGLLQLLAGLVHVHVDTAGRARGDIDQKLARRDGRAHTIDGPATRRGISGTESFQNDSPGFLSEKDVAHNPRSDSGMDLQDGNPRVK